MKKKCIILPFNGDNVGCEHLDTKNGDVCISPPHYKICIEYIKNKEKEEKNNEC